MNQEFQQAFNEIGSEDCDDNRVFPVLEKLIWNLYGFQSMNSVYSARSLVLKNV